MKHAHLIVFVVCSVLLTPRFVIGESPDKKSVKVFILAGQSNMEGHGIVPGDPERNKGLGSLEYLVTKSEMSERFKHLVDGDGTWVARNDVWIWYLDRKGDLTPDYGARPGRIGPELGSRTKKIYQQTYRKERSRPPSETRIGWCYQ